MTAYTARAYSTNALQNIIPQNAHGFVIGNILRFDGVNYVLAQADTFANSQSIGMVNSVLSANQFVLCQAGYIEDIPNDIVEGAPLVAGTLYYLSTTMPGYLTATPTVVTNEVVVPCFISDSTSSGYFFDNAGRVNKPLTSFDWNVVTVNTNMDVNTGYIVNGVGSIDLTLPATASVGEFVRIATLGANGVVVKQNAGQSINFIDVDTTVGVAGELDLLVTNGVLQGALEIVCTVANTNFKVISGNGNWDVI